MRAIWVILILFLGCFKLYAQPYSSSATSFGNFTVSQFQGCAPLTFSMNAPQCDGGNVVSCTQIKGNGELSTPFINSGSVTYNLPGTYTLELVLNNETSRIQIQVFPNTKPDFDLFACNSNNVFVKITDTNINYNTYTVSYSDATTTSLTKGASDIHSLPTGASQVTVNGIHIAADNNMCLPNTKTVNVQSTFTTPTINTVTVNSATEIQLDLSPLTLNEQSIPYRLRYGTNTSNTASFQNYAELNNQSLVKTTGLTPDNDFYCFQLAPFDYCSASLSTPVSNVICSTEFDVTALDGQNKIDWSTSSFGVADYSINKTQGSPTPIPNQAPTTFQFIESILCQPYAYQLTTNYTNGTKSISLIKSVNSFSTAVPPTIQNILSTVNDPGTQVALTWEIDPSVIVKEYSIYRTPNLTTPLTRTAENQFTDDSYTTEDEYCYVVKYENNCNIFSNPSQSVCPLRLTVDDVKDNTITLAWNDYTGYINGVLGYTLERSPAFVTPPLLGSTTTTFTDTDAKADLDNQSYIYYLTVIDLETGTRLSKSNAITVIKDPIINFPTAFTPDGQGQKDNETFKIFGQYIHNNQFEMQIFNRWGELIFSTQDINQGWDGNYRGSRMPEGTYTFIAHLTDNVGRAFTRTGSVVLLRKR